MWYSEKEFELKKMFIKYREIIVYSNEELMMIVVIFLSYFLFSYICSISLSESVTFYHGYVQ